MAPPAPPPSRVFAELDLAPSPAPEGRVEPPALPGREVHVSGSAELSARPDRARVSLRLGSRKEAAAAARSSVSRRLQYIAHSARLHGVPEENMTVTEDFSRVENTFQMEAEVCMIFSDFGKMQNVCNLLIEKLGTSVTINPPHFYHTPEAIDTLRYFFLWMRMDKWLERAVNRSPVVALSCEVCAKYVVTQPCNPASCRASQNAVGTSESTWCGPWARLWHSWMPAQLKQEHPE
ncbi:interleukin-1 receptor-associated kinase 1-binding protein 1 isoform X3 [Taeniopygia guttata]|uniref:interleukin-1 receptor-associated kinase 1-binding protein 1 isoform X3 n=1 Tax=Taeniopygia guttata TaxID=59729 RepID=UPI003BB870C2